jgi:F-type H+-transporting ATPase subunit delta
MRNQTIAKRYARALLALGQADGRFAQYGGELTGLARLIAESGETAKALVSPAFPEGVRRKMLSAILEKAAVSPLVANFLQLLLEKNRLAGLSDIAEAYGRLADAAGGVVRARITSAAPLAPDDLKAIGAALGRFTAAKVELTVERDPGLIGGLVARLGDLTIDGSVRTQINKLSGLLDTL